MKNVKSLSFIALALLFIVGFSACSKDDPIPEIDQEEYNAIELILRKGTQTENGFVLSDEKEIKIAFTKEGVPSPHHVHIDQGAAYRMEVNLFHNGNNINQEIMDSAEEHQFFFLGAPSDLLNYEYEDNKVGLKGILEVVGTSGDAFDFNIVLRHGLNKNHSAAQQWNNLNYAQAGGADDVNVKVEFHVSSAPHGE